MIRKPLAFASVSVLILAAACGDNGTADDTPVDAAGMDQAETDPMAAGETTGSDEAAAAATTGDMADDGRVDRDAMMDETGATANDETGNGGEDAPLLDRLEGDWVSGEDDQSEMSIIDGTATMMYDGEVLTVETLDVVENCPNATGEASDDLELFTMTSDASGETLCYGVISLEDDRLELTSYPRGNTLTYTRQPGTDVLDTE